jgi:hypothetical protein
MRIKSFHHDLCAFANNQMNFLTGHDMFLSDYYFTDQDRDYIYNFPTSNGLTVRETFFANIQKAIDNRGDYGICASHDVAPLIANCFQIRKDYEKEKSFQTYYRKFLKLKYKANR